MFVMFGGTKPKKVTYRYKFTEGRYLYFMGNDGTVYKCHEDSHMRKSDMINAEKDTAVWDFYSATGGKNYYA